MNLKSAHRSVLQVADEMRVSVRHYAEIITPLAKLMISHLRLTEEVALVDIPLCVVC